MAKRISRVEAKRSRGESIRVIIYCRVSSDEQEDNGTSLDTQEKDCRDYAEQHGYIIVEVVRESHTGYELEQRKKFKSVMARCDRGECDAIVFRTYDRLSRDKTHFTVILYDADKYGYELLCVKEQFDENNIFERMLRDMIAYFAEFERAKIKDRTETGRRQRALDGKLLNGSRPRYGYTYADTEHTRYKIVWSEAKTIKRIDELYLQGYGQQLIADILTRDNVPSPNGLKVWSQQSIGNILTCTEYHGEGYAYMRYVTINERGVKSGIIKPVEERIKLPTDVFPQIREKWVYDEIQERRKAAHSTAITSKLPKQVLLRGEFIYCSICGRKMLPNMYGKGKRPRKLAYRCTHRASNNGIDKHSLQINASVIETALLDYVRKALKNLHAVERALSEYIKTHSSQLSVNSYENAIAKVKERQEELAEELKQTRGNARAILLGQLNELESELERLEEYKQKVLGESGRWNVIREDIEKVLEWLRSTNANIDTASFEEKQRILKALGVKAYIKKGDLHPEYDIKALPIFATTG